MFAGTAGSRAGGYRPSSERLGLTEEVIEWTGLSVVDWGRRMGSFEPWGVRGPARLFGGTVSAPPQPWSPRIQHEARCEIFEPLTCRGTRGCSASSAARSSPPCPRASATPSPPGGDHRRPPHGPHRPHRSQYARRPRLPGTGHHHPGLIPGSQPGQVTRLHVKPPVIPTTCFTRPCAAAAWPVRRSSGSSLI